MNVPHNFDKINNYEFLIDGNNFKIETSNENHGNFFVFGDEYNEKYCLYFDIDWIDKNFVVTKCGRGQGSHGTFINQFVLYNTDVKTLKTFLNNTIIETIHYLIKNKLY